MGSLQDDIIKYKKGELGPKEMHALEKRALSDPFLAEALEGLENISSQDLVQAVEALNRRILGTKKKTILFTPLRIAAGVLLISVSVFILYQLTPKQQTIALKTEKSSAAPVQAPPKEPQKQEEKKDESKSITSAKPSPTNEPVKPKERKATSPKIERPKENAIADQLAEGESKPKIEQPVIGKTETTGPEKKAEEIVVVPQEKVAQAIAMEPVKENQTQQDLKTESARRAKKKVNAEALSGAGLPGKVSVASKPISGKVVSAEDGSPLPGVNVLVKGTQIGTVTDADGKFTLETPAENQYLVFSFIGLESQEVNVEGKDDANVELKNDVTQLSEVVVTGLGYAKDNDTEPVIHLAEPEGGIRAYNKYLDTEVRYPEEALKVKIKGKVKVEFAVRTDGSLDEYKVVKGLGYGCDEEVIRLIKEGPKWRPSTENGKPVESTVRVGVKFDPAKAGR